jgi:hypothetical protein
VERSFFGWSLYTSTAHTVRLGEGKPIISNKGGRLGRLFIHPAIMQFGDVIFADVWSALDRERKLVSKMGAIEFHDKSVTLSAREPIQ